MNTINVQTAKTSELLAFYNEHAEKPVNKFTNLETARRRVTALIEALEVSNAAHAAAEQAEQAAKIARKTAKDARKLADAVEATLPVKTEAEDEAPEAKPEKNTKAKPGYEVEHGKTGDKIVVAARRSNAAGIAASWNDPNVREARLYRQGVVVMLNGKALGEYNSTHAAFEALGLPMSKVIRFRMKLKAANKLAFEHAGKSYEFSIL